MEKLSRNAFLFLLFLAASAAAQQAPDGLQFNVPYVCSDGATYVVHRCATGPKGEFCYYQAEGQSERYNTRAAVVYQMTHMCKVKPAATGSAASTSAPSATASSSDLLPNTPYQCPGGLTLTAFQCQKQQSQEYCFVRAEQNGKFVAQAPKPRADVAAQFKACKAGTPFNPPYIAEFPSAYRVVQGMNVGNPADNVRRAIGAFYQLSEIIKVLNRQRGASGLTLDEQKLLTDYSRISGELAQAAAQKLPGEQFGLNTNPYHFSPSDPKFGFEGIPVWTTFLSPGLQTQFAQIVGANNAQYQAAMEQERRKAFQQVQSETQTAQQSQSTVRNDAGSVATRRCLESGRSETECLGKGLRTGLDELTGGLMGEIDKGTAPPPGLRLSGNFSGSGFGVSFDDRVATIYCGTLQPQPVVYQVARGSTIAVKLGINPKPVTVTLRPDGKLVGPGPVQVAGLVPAGGSHGGGSPTGPSASAYDLHPATTTHEQQISAAEASQYSADQVHRNGMEYSVTTTTANSSSDTSWAKPRPSVPMVAKTESCSVTTLTGTPVTKMSAAISQLTGSSPGKGATIPVGLRMYGTYGSQGAGLSIDFEGDLATVECQRARTAEPYVVENAAGRITVHVQNAAAPFSLTLQPDGTLIGTGNVEVAGKVLTGHQGNEMIYAPVSGRCALGTLTAKAGQ